jgi:hypothetical protein
MGAAFSRILKVCMSSFHFVRSKSQMTTSIGVAEEYRFQIRKRKRKKVHFLPPKCQFKWWFSESKNDFTKSNGYTFCGKCHAAVAARNEM